MAVPFLEPWRIDESGDLRDRRGTRVLLLGTREPDWTQVNLRQLCACVNACQGIPNDALNGGIIAELLAMLTRLRNEDRARGWLSRETGDEIDALIAKATGQPAEAE